MNAGNADQARIDDDQVGLIVEVFRMLADVTRVQVLWALVDRELSVNELAEFVDKPAPSVSQHLAKLRMARLVRTRRAGTTIYLQPGERARSPTGQRCGVQRRARRSGCPRPPPRRGRAAAPGRRSGSGAHPRPAQPRRRRQRRQRAGVQRDRYPRGQDQPGGARHHRRRAGRRRGVLRVRLPWRRTPFTTSPMR